MFIDLYEPASVHRAFQEQARLFPGLPAVVTDGRILSYAELNQQANRLAAMLRSRGVRRGDRVGVCIERSVELITAELAVLKAGGAYVPVDPSWPAERIKFLLNDSHAEVAITGDSLGNSHWSPGFDCISAATAGVGSSLEADQDPDDEIAGNDSACVMYTSGSTGVPKGTLIRHKGILRLVKGADYVHFGPGEVFLQMAPASFDASTFEIWGALLNGSSLAMMQPGNPSLADIGRALERYEVSTLWLTAGLFHLIIEQQLDSLAQLRQLVAGGDVLSPQHVRRLIERWPACAVVNGYGPTETTTFACCHRIIAEDLGRGAIPIGRPINKTTVFILDERLQAVAPGSAGEIYIGGDGVAAGYLNQHELTSGKFLLDPFSAEPGARMYRTGDLGKVRADGCIEFLGRIDSQFKINGFRVEPREVEIALARHPDVEQAVVTADPDGSGRKRLVAHVVTRKSVESGELRAFLAGTLPPYMIPSEFVPRKSMPLTANGKVDRKALSAPSTGLDKGMRDRGRDAIEETVLAAWRDALGAFSIPLDRNFFELGGDSLRLLAVHAALEKAWKCELPVTSLLEFSTIRSFADWFGRGRGMSGLSEIRARARRQAQSMRAPRRAFGRTADPVS